MSYFRAQSCFPVVHSFRICLQTRPTGLPCCRLTSTYPEPHWQIGPWLDSAHSASGAQSEFKHWFERRQLLPGAFCLSIDVSTKDCRHRQEYPRSNSIQSAFLSHSCKPKLHSSTTETCFMISVCFHCYHFSIVRFSFFSKKLFPSMTFLKAALGKRHGKTDENLKQR